MWGNIDGFDTEIVICHKFPIQNKYYTHTNFQGTYFTQMVIHEIFILENFTRKTIWFLLVQEKTHVKRIASYIKQLRVIKANLHL